MFSLTVHSSTSRFRGCSWVVWSINILPGSSGRYLGSLLVWSINILPWGGSWVHRSYRINLTIFIRLLSCSGEWICRGNPSSSAVVVLVRCDDPHICCSVLPESNSTLLSMQKSCSGEWICRGNPSSGFFSFYNLFSRLYAGRTLQVLVLTPASCPLSIVMPIDGVDHIGDILPALFFDLTRHRCDIPSFYDCYPRTGFSLLASPIFRLLRFNLGLAAFFAVFAGLLCSGTVVVRFPLPDSNNVNIL